MDYINKIILLITNSYIEKQLSSEELASLARIPQINKNPTFKLYLEQRYNKKMLSIFGFKLDQGK